MKDAAILFIARHATRPGTDASEGWDAVMVCAAFDRRTTVLLLDDGVRLSSGASGASVAAALEAGVETVYADAEACAVRGISTSPGLSVTRIDRDAIRALIASHPVVISI